MARAILSWNVPPPPNTPDFTPIWGNAVEAYVLVRPASQFNLKDILSPDFIKDFSSAIIPEQTITLKPQPEPLHAVLASYEKQGVELHRAVFPMFSELTQNPVHLSKLQSPLLNLQQLPILGGLNIDWTKVLGAIENTDGNIDFEELNCIGLQPRASVDHLVGILKVKKPLGYSGDLCSTGSQEYIRFYMDFGAGWQDMGLSSVQVYDLNELPKSGLHYAVLLPVNLDQYRNPCQKGPVFAKMRAIMSWNSPPPANTPNYKPTWGNAEETTVLLSPKNSNSTGLPAPAITAVCGQSVAEINQFTGLLTNGGFNKAPFANSLWISGHIGNAPDASSGAIKLKYRLMVSNKETPVIETDYKPITNSFDIRTEQLSGGVWTFPPAISQTPDADGWVAYQEDLTNPVQTFTNLDILGVVHTVGDVNLYRWLRIDVQDALNPATIYKSVVVKVRVDNAAPTATITMDQGPCSDINIGAEITGSYVTADEHYSHVAISVLGNGGGVAHLTPSSASAMGESGTWSFSTAGMTACGYVVQLTSWDRAIIGYVSGTAYAASGGHHYQPLAIGFCLRKL